MSDESSSSPNIQSQHIHQQELDNLKVKKRLILRQLHDAAQIGDVDSIKTIFHTHKDIPIDITRKGFNTTLHTTISHNQEGPLIDYLIQNGADVNAENTKGHLPLTLAIIHCKGSKAAKKLIAAGASWEEKFESGAHIGLSAMDVAIKYDNKLVVALLENLLNKDYCQKIAANEKNEPRRGWQLCPICNVEVRFPTKMSRLESDQECIEKAFQNNNGEHVGGKGKKKQKKYKSRKYMDQLLAHSDGEAYKKLCSIEYHDMENMRLRKEISESYGVLHAVQECCVSLGISTNNKSASLSNSNNNINLENIFLIDLCSGKGVTTALCAACDVDGSNNYFLAIDRMLSHTIPHFLNEGKVHYLSRDIMAEAMFAEVADIVRDQTRQGRTCILVGMHLCGLLSDRAIDFFERVSEIKGLVLSPCCLPKKIEQRRLTGFKKGKPENGAEDAELYNYFKWSDYLKGRVEGCYSGGDVSDVRLYRDDEMHTEKNAIIVGVKR